MSTSVGLEAPAGFNFTRDVVEALGAHDDRRALSYVGTDGVIQRLTFGELAADAARWAHLLRGRGHEAGERVLVLVGAAPDWAPIMLGAIKGGLVPVPCPVGIRPSDLADRAMRTTASLLVAAPDALSAARSLVGTVDHHVDVVALEEAPPLLARCRPEAPTETRRPGDPALVLFTAGTSGPPRGVVHGQAYLRALASQAHHWLDAAPGDVVWCTAPADSAAAVWGSLVGPWSAGAEVVVYQGGTVAEQIDLLDRLGVTVLCQAPREYRRMLAEGSDLGGAQLRHAVSTGDPLGSEVTAGFRDLTGLTICDGYGQTENAVLVASAPGTVAPDGSLGYATPGHEVAIVDEDGRPVGPGEEGDIALRGRPPALFLGYLGAPEAAAAASRADWYLTGDRGLRDDSGAFWFAGRADDRIACGDRLVNAFEVERALERHPAVLEAAVVGRPDRRLGQVPRASVVTRPGVDAEGLPAELAVYAAGACGLGDRPLPVEVVDDLPRCGGGKVDRAALRRGRSTRAASQAEPPARERPLRLVLGGAHAGASSGPGHLFAAEPLAAPGRALDEETLRSRRGDRARQRAEERERRRAEEAERREAEQQRKAVEAARRAQEEQRRKAAAEEREREAAGRKAEERRRRAEAKALEEEQAAARHAAREAERAEKAAERAEEQRLLAAAKERKRLAAEQRRAEEHARKEETRRQRAEEEERRKQQDQARRAAAARQRAEAREADARVKAEAEERRREEEAARRAERDAAKAEAARLEAERTERRRQEELGRKEAQARAEEERRAEQAALQVEREIARAEAARLVAEAKERRRHEEEAARAERDAARAEAARLEAEAKELRRQEELERREADARRQSELAEAKRRADEEARREQDERQRAADEAQRLRRSLARNVSGDPLAAQPPAADDRPARAAGGSPARPTAPDAGRPRRAVERTATPEEDGADVADLMVARIKSYGVHGERQGRSPS